ncbi:unnamed protein product [Caenorhabditis bovis]|uniref:PWI domain-containing protein n=1 Tax=Caenorhabditis bovis TaxID=2654633 RepID=A0A8S1ED16_9PELO|nr:unnamed protein product [Caenorhabditis bovis]
MAFRPGGYSMPFQSYGAPIMFGQMRMPTAAPKQMEPMPVFVGNISEKCSEEFLQKMLEECGKVSSWKRVQGTNGKLQGFGFCNFAEPEGTLRALRILNDFHLGDKKLTVKAEEKVRKELRNWSISHRRALGKKDIKLQDNELPADEDDLKKDEEIRLKILNWIENDYPELLTLAEDGEISEKEAKDKKEEKQRNNGDRKKLDREKRRRSRSRSEGRKRSRSPATPRNKRSRRSRSASSSSTASRSSSTSESGSSDSSRSRSPIRNKSSKRRRDRSGTRSSEDSDEARERRAIRHQVKEKEVAYMQRLHRWEAREKQRAKMYERAERKEKERKKELQKEAKRLRHFLEDYDDEKDDPKYYKSSSLFQRKRDFEKEREADQKDRLREQHEIEELKKQILAENSTNSIDVEEEARKRHQRKEEEALRKYRGDSGSPNPHKPLGHSEVVPREESSSSEDEGSSDEEKTNDEPAEAVETATPGEFSQKPNGGWKAIGGIGEEQMDIARPPPRRDSPQVGISSVQPIAQRLNGVFGNDDPEEDEIYKRKKLKPFQITREERMQVMTAEEKKELTRGIIKKIPTSKDELFATPIEWDFIDAAAMEQRVKPWVAKKVQEFLGEEEKQLVDFICEKIEARTPPDQILKDIAMIIDDDADMFVVKMWRLLVFEGQSRKLGINP